MRTVGRLGVLVAALVLSAGSAAYGVDSDDGQIDGGTNSGKAALIEPGSYADKIGPDGSDTAERWYRYERTYKESSVLLGVSSRTPEGSVSVTATTDDGASCGEDSASAPLYGGPFGAGVAVPDALPEPEPDADPDPCLGSDLLIKVTGQSGLEKAVDFRLTVWEEPKVLNQAALPSAVDPDTVTFKEPESSGSASAVSVGKDLSTAPEVSPGTYTATVTSGDSGVLKVPVAYGQTLAVRALVIALTDEMEDAGLSLADIKLALFNPLGEPVGDTPEGVAASDSISSSPSALSAGTVAVRWANRIEAVSESYVAGDYYLAFSVDELEEGEADVDVTIEIGVTGEETGVPEFADGEELLGPDANSDGPLPDGVQWPLAIVLGLAGAGCLTVGARQLKKR